MSCNTAANHVPTADLSSTSNTRPIAIQSLSDKHTIRSQATLVQHCQQSNRFRVESSGFVH